MKPFRVAFFLLALCPLGPIPAFGEDPKELRDLRLDFQIELAALNKPLQNLNDTYRGHLEKQKAAYQQTGNLRAVLAVDEELKSFESTPGEALSSFPELSRLQGIYREQRARIEGKPSA